MYDQGACVDRDLIKAASWYRKAAEQGFTDAQTNLGMMHYRGEGVPLDLTEAAKWFQLAADKGDTEAVSLLKRISRESSENNQATVA